MKIYGKDTNKLKELLFDLKFIGDGIKLVCVDQEGKQIAIILDIIKSGIVISTNARNCLRHNGYDTSEVGWDEHGRIQVTKDES